MMSFRGFCGFIHLTSKYNIVRYNTEVAVFGVLKYEYSFSGGGGEGSRER